MFVRVRYAEGSGGGSEVVCRFHLAEETREIVSYEELPNPARGDLCLACLEDEWPGAEEDAP